MINVSTVIAATAGSASASDIALRGGMSLIDGTFITACLMGIAAIISACGGVVWANRRNARKRPLDSQDVYVTRCECEQHRLAIAKRIDELGPALERIFLKLSENDKKSEDRANQMHRRIDPLIERTAANTQAIEMFKDFARKATVGGKEI